MNDMKQTFGVVVSMCLIMVLGLSSIVRAETTRTATGFFISSGTVFSGNLGSLAANDSNALIVNETVIHNATVDENFHIPIEDGLERFWGQSGCDPSYAYDCIDDDPPTDGDGDATYLYNGPVFLGPTTVNISAGTIPPDALITTPEPFLLIRARTTGVGTDFIDVATQWRDGNGNHYACALSVFAVTAQTYANYGVSIPLCGVDPWNVTMLNSLTLVFNIPSDDSNPNTVRLTMAYVRTNTQNVLYNAAIGVHINFTAILANRVNRVVWVCNRVSDVPMSLSILDNPPAMSRIVVGFGGMCEGINEDNYAPIYATDIGSASISFSMSAIDFNFTATPGFLSVEQFVLILNGTGTTSIASFGGALCWLIGGGIVMVSMVVVIVYKKRSGRGTE